VTHKSHHTEQFARLLRERLRGHRPDASLARETLLRKCEGKAGV
jgi:hypothetical protein